jgi:hypothetical protein
MTNKQTFKVIFSSNVQMAIRASHLVKYWVRIKGANDACRQPKGHCSTVLNLDWRSTFVALQDAQQPTELPSLFVRQPCQTRDMYIPLLCNVS